MLKIGVIIMKNIHRIVIVLLVLFFVNSAYAFTVKEYEDIRKKGNEEDKKLIEVYVSGLGQGAFWSNIELSTQGTKPLFCSPKKIALNARNYIQILEETIQYRRDIALGDKIYLEKLEKYNIELILIKGLINTFPCPK
jgi:hypothetical protein